jgi:hypothetical protein
MNSHISLRMNKWLIESQLNNVYNIEELKAKFDLNKNKNLPLYKMRERLFDDFFIDNPPPVDIALILYSALHFMHILAYYIDTNNILLYKPKSSHRYKTEYSFLKGTPHPNRTLLLFDGDMVTGKAAEEASSYFEKLGYKREKIFIYLEGGFSNPSMNQTEYSPRLDQIDTIFWYLERYRKLNNRNIK